MMVNVLLVSAKIFYLPMLCNAGIDFKHPALWPNFVSSNYLEIHI